MDYKYNTGDLTIKHNLKTRKPLTLKSKLKLDYEGSLEAKSDFQYFGIKNVEMGINNSFYGDFRNLDNTKTILSKAFYQTDYNNFKDIRLDLFTAYSFGKDNKENYDASLNHIGAEISTRYEFNKNFDIYSESNITKLLNGDSIFHVHDHDHDEEDGHHHHHDDYERGFSHIHGYKEENQGLEDQLDHMLLSGKLSSSNQVALRYRNDKIQNIFRIKYGYMKNLNNENIHNLIFINSTKYKLSKDLTLKNRLEALALRLEYMYFYDQLSLEYKKDEFKFGPEISVLYNDGFYSTLAGLKLDYKKDKFDVKSKVYVSYRNINGTSLEMGAKFKGSYNINDNLSLLAKAEYKYENQENTGLIGAGIKYSW